ncbi:MAG: ABC transporter permease [Bacteroidota bacterium]
MIKNYFIVAWRNLVRNKIFTTINMLGLAVGIAVFLLIFQYVAYEYNSNRFHTNFKNLYRASVVYKDGSNSYYLPSGFAPIITQRFTGIASCVRVADGLGSGVISITDDISKSKTGVKSFSQNDISYVDGDFLTMFSFPLLAGTTSLHQPKTMALSEELAIKYFGNTNAVGKVVTVSNQFGNTPYTIIAVLKKIDQQSDIKTGMLLSLKTLESQANRNGNDWADPNGIESGFTNIYLQLKPGIEGPFIASEITKFVHSINPDSKSDNVVFQPFEELHLAPSINYSLQTFGSLLMVIVFTSVALLILLIAWINYINLSTAQALKRAREVGVRKVLGATRSQLMLQYLSETFLLTISAAIIGILIVQLIQPIFNTFTERKLSLAVLNNGYFWLAGAILILSGSFFSGSYVAFVLSSFQPIKTIRGKVENVVGGFSLRKSLVVFQFTISIVFIISTIVLYKQLQYMRTKELGMNINQLLVVKGPTLSSEGQAEKNLFFKNELSQLPFVKKVAASNNVPGQGYNFSANGFTSTNPQPGDDKKNYSMLIVDDQFFNTYGIKFKEGTTFTSEQANQGWMNSKRVVLNEKAAAQFGFRMNEPAAGKKIMWGNEAYEVTGIIKDYHHLSLREAILPAIYLPSVSFSYFTIQTDAINMQDKIKTLRNLFLKSFSGNPFEYFFADENYDKQYNTEQKLGNVFIASALVAIFIACLGLFGLTSFAAQQRVKEIGIRKVLGASIADITKLLSRDFVKLVFVSIVIATPLAWWAMHKWLQDFAYRTDISWWMFLLAGVIALIIALATVSFQAVKAAITNPVDNLRTE